MALSKGKGSGEECKDWLDVLTARKSASSVFEAVTDISSPDGPAVRLEDTDMDCR